MILQRGLDLNLTLTAIIARALPACATVLLGDADCKDMRMAMVRADSNILTGSLWKAIPLFALPVAATSILEQLSSLVGMMVLGRLSSGDGTLAMAAVGSNTPIVSLIVNLFVGLALGANVIVAHAAGRGDSATMERTSHTAVAVSVVGIAVAAVCELLAEPVLDMLSVPPETMPGALLYLRIYLVAIPAVLLYNLEAAVFRGVGITKMPLQALALSCALCVVLDLVFIPVLGWDVAGAATATAISYYASAAMLFVRLLTTSTAVRINPRKLRVDARTLARIVKVGLPAGIQGAVFAIANIIIQGAVNSLGNEVLAASSAAMALEFVLYNLVNSFGQACTTFVGQNFGARNIDRCKRVLKVCLVEDAAVTAALALCMVLFGRQIVGLFNSDPEVIELGYVRVCCIFPAYLASMTYETLSGYLRGFGISLLPAVLTTLGVCGTRIFWVACVFSANPTFLTLMLVYPVSLTVTALLILGAVLFCQPAKVYGKKKQAAA